MRFSALKALVHEQIGIPRRTGSAGGRRLGVFLERTLSWCAPASRHGLLKTGVC